jgi:glucose-1-phosphatase
LLIFKILERQIYDTFIFVQMIYKIPENITSIIFDLGGVLLDLDLQKTFDAFDALGFKGFDQHFDSYSGSPFIEIFEEGKMTNEAFIATAKTYCNEGTTTAQVLTAWNAMLGPLQPQKIEMLELLRKRYKLFVYSNTNALHVAYLQKYYTTTFGNETFKNIFEKIYYSNEFGIRKPNTEGFLKIVEEQHLVPQDTLFIDDGKMHIAAAKTLGIKTLQWIQNEDISKFLNVAN